MILDHTIRKGEYYQHPTWLYLPPLWIYQSQTQRQVPQKVCDHLSSLQTAASQRSRCPPVITWHAHDSIYTNEAWSTDFVIVRHSWCICSQKLRSLEASGTHRLCQSRLSSIAGNTIVRELGVYLELGAGTMCTCSAYQKKWGLEMEPCIIDMYIIYLAEQTEWENEHIARLQVSVDDLVHMQKGKSTSNLRR